MKTIIQVIQGQYVTRLDGAAPRTEAHAQFHRGGGTPHHQLIPGSLVLSSNAKDSVQSNEIVPLAPFSCHRRIIHVPELGETKGEILGVTN